MKVWKKLQNPFVLVGQGFVLGGALFFGLHGVGEAQPVAQPSVAVEAAR